MKDAYLILFCLLGAIILFILYRGAMNKNATEFKWYATESAPEHYPMEIRQGTFYYKDQNQGLYIPSGGTLNTGWGRMISSHVTGAEKKPLPDRVEVTYFSYAEKQFYRGKFNLPYEQMLTAFQIGRAHV